MSDDKTIEFEETESLAAGAIGRPGERVFYVQAEQRGMKITILVEKQQVAMLAAESGAFLDRLADEFPEGGNDTAWPLPRSIVEEPAVPLFRARTIGIGYEPDRQRVLIELQENFPEDEESLEEPEGFIVKIYATRAQVRAMSVFGAASVGQGRPPCPLCTFPMDLDRHICPRWN